MPVKFGWWNWKVTYAIALLILFGILYYLFTPLPEGAPGVTASIVWGTVTLTLSLIFMLGAAQTPIQFLVFFGTGAFGAGMGYLVGAWLTPSGSANPLEQIRTVVAGVLTGVVGTKLLALWDDLVKEPAEGGRPRILTAPFFLPIVLWLVGFTVSLSAFYTVRTAEAGEVRITFSPQSAVNVLGGNRFGLMPETEVEFAGAANSPEDVTVTWDFRLKEACGEPLPNTQTLSRMEFQKQTASVFNPVTGKLTTPTQKALEDWIKTCPGSQDWTLTATSNQNRSKSSEFEIKFCRTNQECKVATPPPGAVPAPRGRIPSETGQKAGESGTVPVNEGKATEKATKQKGPQN